MPRNGGSSRKRPAESEANYEFDDHEEEDPAEQERDEEMEGASSDEVEEQSDDEEMGEQQEPEQLMGSPSPASKDMRLRSGRRKRRRSKETTGLTPPDELKASKKARPTTERKSKAKAEVTPVNKEDRMSKSTTVVGTKTKLALPPRTSTKGRASLLSSDPEAVALAQDPQTVGSPLELPDTESSRRLFDGKLPYESTAADAPSAQPPVTVKSPEPSQPRAPREGEETQPTSMPTNGYHTVRKILRFDTILSNEIFLRICFMFVLAMPLHMILWPVCVSVSDFIIPLRELTVQDGILPDSIKPVIIEQAGEDHTMEGPLASLARSLESLRRIQERASHKLETLQSERQVFREAVDELSLLLNEKKGLLQDARNLHQAEMLLHAALDDETGLDSAIWPQVRESLHGLGRTILDTTSIELWQVDVPEGCEDLSASVMEGGDSSVDVRDVESNRAIDANEFKETVRELAKRSIVSAKRLVESPEAEEAVRTWIEREIENALEEHQHAAAALDILEQAAQEAQSSFSEEDSGADNTWESGVSIGEIEEIVKERLEMELADRTGEFDFAAITNGARIIRQGKWATSQSLVDSLPLGNRLLQLSKLQFYGFGPEVAITPTYPLDSLGQCWSFQETPVEKMIRLPLQGDGGGEDHKSGNFGTFTVSLPTSVRVKSVVIEHPPKGLTDQIDSAIRYFRVVGFEDSEATTRSWHLGSFEYYIKSPYTLQEFEVATEIFGRVVPPLRSISLAVDANWGHDYACLYRFRVHGQEVEIVDVDDEL